MTNIRLVLLATTALTAAQFASVPSHAQSAPVVTSGPYVCNWKEPTTTTELYEIAVPDE